MNNFQLNVDWRTGVLLRRVQRESMLSSTEIQRYTYERWIIQEKIYNTHEVHGSGSSHVRTLSCAMRRSISCSSYTSLIITMQMSSLHLRPQKNNFSAENLKTLEAYLWTRLFKDADHSPWPQQSEQKLEGKNRRHVHATYLDDVDNSTDFFALIAKLTDQQLPLHEMLDRSNLHTCETRDKWEQRQREKRYSAFVHDKHAELELDAYRATKIYAAVCITIAPSPAGFDVFMHLALNQFSWIDVTKSAIQISISRVCKENYNVL